MAIYQDEILVKRAYKKVNYTEEQIDELTECFKRDTGPMYFLRNYMYVQNATQGRIKFTPYDFQVGLLDCYHNYKKSIAMCSRQSGKCLDGNTKINIRNKKTGEVMEVTFEEFEDIIKKV